MWQERETSAGEQKKTGSLSTIYIKLEKGVLGQRRKVEGVGVGGENPQERTIYKNAIANLLHCGQIKKQNLLTFLNKESSSPKFGN